MFRLVILLALISVLGAEDSCEQVSEYLCGDLCIDTAVVCRCGNETLKLWDPSHSSDMHYYCCLPPGDDRQQCYLDDDDAGYCEQGQLLYIQEQCHGECFNSYQRFRSGRLGLRSQYQCEDGECVFALLLCRSGYAVCQDKSDLKECSKNLDCLQIGESHVSALGSAHHHHECQYEWHENDGIYDNIGRGDEGSLTQQVQFSPIDYTELEECTDYQGAAGLMCGRVCSEVREWCREESMSSCNTDGAHYNTNAGPLCRNTTFWRGVSCDVPWGDGEMLAFGKRCTANAQHCYYPWYTRNMLDLGIYIRHESRPDRVSDLQPWGWHSWQPTCQDNSDRIFDLNTKCNISAYVDEYCSRICNKTNRLTFCQEEVCQDTENWISLQVDDFILDPHHCWSSCQVPGRGCEACTNTERFFNCSRSGVCIHRDLLCDGHQHCRHGEDEQLDHCYDTYIERDVIKEYGTLRCPSIMYPDIETVAVVCDGVPECVDSEDEPDMCRNSNVSVYVIGSLVVLITVWNIMERLVLDRRFHKVCPVRSIEMRMKESRFSDESRYREFHSSQSFSTELNILLAELKYSRNKEKIKEVGAQILRLEQKIHENSENELCLCLHKSLKPKLFELMMDVLKPGIIERKLPKLKKLIEKITEDIHFVRGSGLSSLIFTMMEIAKDNILVFTILVTTGGSKALLYYPEKFTSTIVFCLLVTIVVPLMFSTLGLALGDPGVILKPYNLDTKVRRTVIQALVTVLSVLNPILLVNSKNENYEQLRREYGEALLSRLEDGARIKREYVKYLKTELGLETFYQVPIQVILLLVARTLTKTNGGLEVFFEQTEILGLSTDSLLIISILLSSKTCVTLHLKQIKTDKEFLPFTSQVLIFLWGLFASAKRVMAMVAVFVPSLGLFSVLHHWQAEQIPFSMRMEASLFDLLTPTDILELNGLRERVFWKELDRTDWTDPDNPVFAPYTAYTGLTLGQTFFAFLVLFYLHLIAVITVKIITAESMRGAGKLELLRHCLENMNIPVPHQDFDVREGGVRDYRARRRRVNREMFWLMLVNFIVSILMLTPLIYTGYCFYLKNTGLVGGVRIGICYYQQ